ncbi:MAG: MFS transporter [Candidatus Jidaibacter sp.]|jgi:MHS family proline/betaine transporter-like MFS transporter|nr:MFS transporter [Candidatus Jidaibacter sp.]
MRKRKIVGPAIVGNIVEYYDFGLFAVYAPIIGSLFFPMGDQFLQTLSAFATFAVGFLMRPLGGLVFGYIGDRFGRKLSLTISILGMALCTFLIGILPSYETIGAAAPVMLIIVRLFQGLCVGGEGAGVAIFVLEHLEGYRPGLMGSIVMASNMVGTLLAVFIGIMLNHFCSGGDACWRYAFIFGGFTGLIGLYLRYQLGETPQFISKKDSNQIEKHPIVAAFKNQTASMVIVMFLGGFTSAVAYTIRGYLNTFFREVMQYTSDDSLYFTSFALLIMIVLLPVFGMLSDRVGYRRFLNIICYMIILFIVPVYMMLANPQKDITLVLLGLMGIATLAAGICAPAYCYAIKAFEVELRFSGVAFSWNLGLALLGGTTPMISRILSEKIGIVAPAYYLLAIAIAFVIASFFTKNKYKLKSLTKS